MIEWKEVVTDEGLELFEATFEGFALYLSPAGAGWLWGICDSETEQSYGLGGCLTRESAEAVVKAKLRELLEEKEE